LVKKLLCCAAVSLRRIKHQEHWLKQQAAAHRKDPYWQVVALSQAQVDGLYAGYAAAMTAAEAAAAAAGLQLDVPRFARMTSCS